VFGETEADGTRKRVARSHERGGTRSLLGRPHRPRRPSDRKVVRSTEGQAIGGILKGAASRSCRQSISTVGGYFGGATGAKFGGDTARAAGRAFGLELEGLSGEDREFEVARRYVNFAGEAVKNLAMAPSGRTRERRPMRRRWLRRKPMRPGLLSPRQAGIEPQTYSSYPSGQSGRWMRRGNKIILYGFERP